MGSGSQRTGQKKVPRMGDMYRDLQLGEPALRPPQGLTGQARPGGGRGLRVQPGRQSGRGSNLRTGKGVLNGKGFSKPLVVHIFLETGCRVKAVAGDHSPGPRQTAPFIRSNDFAPDSEPNSTQNAGRGGTCLPLPLGPQAELILSTTAQRSPLGCPGLSAAGAPGGSRAGCGCSQRGCHEQRIRNR